jgi:hypothetical protein
MHDYFVGWAGLAVINAALANADHRGPLKYFLLSLLFGPLVTIALATTYERSGALHLVDLWRGKGAA